MDASAVAPGTIHFPDSVAVACIAIGVIAIAIINGIATAATM
jgi:hypothetical protein